MQQEQQHSEQRYPFVSKHTVGKHPARKAARDKEQVDKQVTHQVDVAAVLQPDRALRQQQGHFKGDAVVAIGDVHGLG